MTRWTHAHTAATSLLAGLYLAHHALALAAGMVVLGLVAGWVACRFRQAVRKATTAAARELQHRAAVQAAGLREKRAKARLAVARARDAEAVAAEARRRAERARGVTNSEIAQLQIGQR